MKLKAKTVSGYISGSSKEAKKKLSEIRVVVKGAAPKAVESIKWGMPAVSYERILVMYAAFKNHIGFYPTPSAIKKFKKDLSKYKTSRGAIQFPLYEPLPLGLIKRITAFRAKEETITDKKWRQ